jgi:hypothetical protein
MATAENRQIRAQIGPPLTFAYNAAKYAAIGWPVFPLRGKKPAIRGGRGVHDASCDLNLIEQWASEYPDANIGVACGGLLRLIVIDVDPRHGGNLVINKLALNRYFFPMCPEAATGNGGRHMVFSLPEGIALSTFKLGEGIDVKSAGGYIVLAPSVTGPSEAGPGGPYRWLRDPWSTPLPALPDWAIARLQPPKRNVVRFTHSGSPGVVMRRLDGLAISVANAPTGSRNSMLNWAAFTAGEIVRDGHVDAATVERALFAAGLQCGLTEPEIRRTVTSALRAACEKGRPL